METIYISNETFKVDWSILDDWMEWVIKTLIPAIQKSEHVTSAKLVKIVSLDDMDGPTYALQVGHDSKASYNHYMELELPQLMQPAYERWKDRFVGFRTLMEVINIDE